MKEVGCRDFLKGELVILLVTTPGRGREILNQHLIEDDA
jgi:hypothetical protein